MLTTAVQNQAIALKNEQVAVFFSGGKDAIVTADLWMRYHKGPKKFVYMYFVAGLTVVESVLRFYEQKWRISIDRIPCHETRSLISRAHGGRKYKYKDVEQEYLAQNQISWCVTGMKRADSLARRGQFKHIGDDWTDTKLKHVYPVLGWTDKQILAYCRLNRLPLPITYNHGIKRSFWIPDADYLIWLKGVYPADYEKIVATFPQFGDAVFKRIRGI